MKRLLLWRRLVMFAAVVLVLAMAWPAYQSVRGVWLVGKARDALMRADSPTALKYLEQLPVSWHSRADATYLMARTSRQLFRQKEFDFFSQRALELGWERQDIDRQKLLWQIQSGEVAIAEELLRRDDTGNTSDEAAVELYDAYIRGCLNTYRFPQALHGVDNWLQWQPDAIAPRFYRGLVFSHLNDYDVAMAEFGIVLQQDPTNYQARLYLGTMLLKKSRVREAKAIAEQLSREFSHDSESRLLLAECQERLGELEESLETISGVLSAKTSDRFRAEALAMKARVLEKRRDYKSASECLVEAASLLPFDAVMQFSAGSALVRAGERQRGQELVDRSKQIRASDQEIGKLRRIVHVRPEDAQLRYAIGKKYFEIGNVDEALPWVNTALGLDPKLAAAHETMAKYLESEGRTREAARHRQIVVDLGDQATPEMPEHLDGTESTDGAPAEATPAQESPTQRQTNDSAPDANASLAP